LSRGFTLIELLIVVAIILVIVAIAIPSFLRARIAANETAAAENVRTIVTASVAYNSTWANGYPPSLAALGGPSASASTCDAANLIDPVLAAGQKSSYTFTYTGQSGPVVAASGCSAPGYNGFLVSATPLVLGVTGGRSFCSDTPGIIHVDITGTTAASIASCDALPGLQ
jgi:type IV pilus assembly protein PilA